MSWADSAAGFWGGLDSALGTIGSGLDVWGKFQTVQHGTGHPSTGFSAGGVPIGWSELGAILDKGIGGSEPSKAEKKAIWLAKKAKKEAAQAALGGSSTSPIRGVTIIVVAGLVLWALKGK